jgi:drug/metabolite transporter (DMT)-like permease
MDAIMDRTQRDGVLYILLSVTGYSVLPVLVKQIQATGLASLDIATWRFIFAAPLFWLFVFASQRLSSPVEAKTHRPLPRVKLLLLGALLAVAALTAFFGLESLSAGTFVILFYTYPAMVALLSLFLGERLPAQGWAALGLTLVGTVLTVPDFGAGFGGASGQGVVLAILNALIVAVYFILNSRVLRGHTALAQASAWAITGSCAVFVVLALFRQVAVPSQPTTWVYLLVLASFSTVMPVFALTNGLQKLGASRAAILSTIEPLMTMAFAALFLAERMQAVQLVGGALIVFSVLLLQLPRREARLKVEAAEA